MRLNFDLRPALEAERHRMRGPSGSLAWYSGGRAHGRPVVLVHGLHVAASAYDVAPIFDTLRWRRPTFAVELPGFGLSSRDDVAYSPRMMTDALLAMLRRTRSCADVIALGESAEFAARAACEQPELVRSLTFVAPSLRTARARVTPHVDRVLRSSLGGQAAFELLVSRPALRFSIGRTFFGEPPAALLDYAYETARQPGARFAPLAWLRGELASADASAIFASLQVPTLVVHDEDFLDSASDVELFVRGSGFAGVRSAARVFPSRGMPHFERPEHTMGLVSRFFTSLDYASRVRATH